MKLANPTLIGQGRLALALALVPLALTGCPADSTPGATDGESTEPTDDSDDESGDDDDSSATEDETTGEDSTSSSSTTDEPETTSTTEDGSDSSSSTTGPPPGGLGCGVRPVCDKGELVGSAQVMSADDIDMIAGHTTLTGWLEITNTDLECLDFLACLETVGHDVTIFGNDFLLDVSGTNNITDLGVSTADMGAADRDGTLVFSQNNLITDFNGFNALRQTQQSLTISDNESLVTISGFTNLVGAVRDVTIRFNAALEEVADGGLKGILFIGQECVITNNASFCITDIQDICGDLKKGPAGGNTANNKDC